MKSGALIIVLFIILNNSDTYSTARFNKIGIVNDTVFIEDSTKTILRMNDTIIHLNYNNSFDVKTEVLYPHEDTSIIGTILLLHGWNLPASQWCDSTDFCTKALSQGYILIIPDYALSNYTLEIYPETISKYTNYPTLTWIMETQIVQIQKNLQILNPGQNNYIAGISTGARGATLLAYYMPEIFKGAASLSGDFDITRMQTEYLYYSFIGRYTSFPKRWKKECFAYDCENYIVPTYIGHGINDGVSPVSQSIAMYDSIKKHQPLLQLQGHFPKGEGHNYKYWRSETDSVLNFFRQIEIEE